MAMGTGCVVSSTPLRDDYENAEQWQSVAHEIHEEISDYSSERRTYRFRHRQEARAQCRARLPPDRPRASRLGQVVPEAGQDARMQRIGAERGRHGVDAADLDGLATEVRTFWPTSALPLKAVTEPSGSILR